MYMDIKYSRNLTPIALLEFPTVVQLDCFSRAQTELTGCPLVTAWILLFPKQIQQNNCPFLLQLTSYDSALWSPLNRNQLQLCWKLKTVLNSQFSMVINLVIEDSFRGFRPQAVAYCLRSDRMKKFRSMGQWNVYLKRKTFHPPLSRGRPLLCRCIWLVEQFCALNSYLKLHAHLLSGHAALIFIYSCSHSPL